MATVEQLLKQQELIKQMDERYQINVSALNRELEQIEKEVAEYNQNETKQETTNKPGNKPGSNKQNSK